MINLCRVPENMALGSKLAKSMNSPWMIWSLICGGTGGNDDLVTIVCTSVGTKLMLKIDLWWIE